MNFIEDYDSLLVSEKQTFQKICCTLLKQTFIVCDKNEESRKIYFFVRKHDVIFSSYLSYMGFDIFVAQGNKVVVLLSDKGDGGQTNRLRLCKNDGV